MACASATAQIYTNGPITASTPPQPCGAVGSNFVMTVLNPEFQVQDRTGGVVSVMSHARFWTNSSTIAFAPGGYPYAPRVLYDSFAGRWIVAAAADAFTTNAAFLLAVSDGHSPTGTWSRYRIPVDTNEPLTANTLNLGINRHWIALHGNIITGTNYVAGKDFSTSNTTLVRTDLLVVDKAGLYTNGPLRYTRFALSSNDWHMAPAVTYDDSLDALFLAHIPRAETMPVISMVTGPVGAETLSPGVATAQVYDAWQYFQPALQPFGPQLGSPEKIDLMDGRMRSLVYRNGSLWMCHTIFLPLGGVNRSAVQWWQVATNGVVQQRGRIEDPEAAVCYAYPSLAVNAENDVLIGFTAFSTSFYASAGYAYRAGIDPPSVTRPPRLYKMGEAPYVAQTAYRNVWGEYSATVVDPLDDARLWTLQTYAHSPSNRWSTWWAAVTAPAAADLALGKTANLAYVRIGSNVTYTIAVTNRGPDASDTTVVDALPAQLAFVSATPSTGACAEAGGTVTWTVGALASNDSAVLTLTALAVTPGRTENSATAHTDVETDVNLADNTSTASVSVLFDVLPDVWINEIHYDDTNGFLDLDEGVEIAGPAGAMLDGLELLFYKGWTRTVYANLLLTGTIDHETNGYGAVWFDVASLNDGGILHGDGIALVPAGTGVIQFISYEGDFIAVDGQAAGQKADDIGVEESDTTTPPGYALQLIGNGIGYGDFAWQNPAPHSRGELNPGQTIPADADGDGIPSWWEYLYFGGPTNADAGADGDGDGLNEEGEYTADTHPTNPASRFCIATVALSNTWPVVTFDTSAQRLYGLESSTNLLFTNLWREVRDDVPGVGGPLSIADTNFPGPAHFYRGRVRVP
jgi:uncharacterized repeat protein (TIGR01451 family)